MIIYTRHAVERMAEMGITQAQVKDLLEAPDLSYPSPRGGYSNTIATADRHRFAVVYAEGTHDQTIITVVHRVEEPYVRAGAGYLLALSLDEKETGS